MGVCLFLHLYPVREGHDLVLKQREAALEVIMRLNPVTCVQTH